MRFVTAMAWREIRASWRRLILFFLCVALGVGAMVSLRSVSRVFVKSLARDSRMLLSADVRAETGEAWTPEHLEVLSRRDTDPRVLARTRMIELQTIVRAENRPETRPIMVELRGVEASFPLRGEVRLAGGAAYSPALLASRGAVVSPSLLERLHIGVGDPIRIGTQSFTVRAAAERIPGAALNFSLMPRVLVEYDAPEASGLITFGSRVRHYWLFNVTDDVERQFAQEIAREYRERRLRGGIGTFHVVENWLSGSLANIDGFLSLIGLAIVVLGGIGIASVTRVFVQQRIRTVAILKCLGGRNRRVLGAYLAQVLVLSLAGSLLGLAVAKAITTTFAGYASRRLPLDVDPSLSAVASVQGVAVGVLIALLFALPALLEIRDVKPHLVLRQDVQNPRRFDWLRLGAQVLIAAAIAVLAGSMAGTYRNASLFVGGIFGAVVVLHFAGTLLMWVLAQLRTRRSFVVRHGIGSLYRPGNQTQVTLFTVGLGALFMIAVRLFQVNVQQEYTIDLSDLSADMFLVDVQPGQRDVVEASLSELGATDVRLLAVARGRLAGLNRSPSNRERVPANRVGGEMRLTERLELEPSEVVVDGQFWPASASAEPEVSIESGYADWLALRIGDRLVFEIAGRRLEARVTSVRRLDRRARTLTRLVRADVLFRPGTLHQFPHTFLGGAKGPGDVAARARLQNEMLSRYPAITLVDALDEIGEIRRRIADLSTAISILGGFVLVCGALTLVGSIVMTKMQRVYEAAVLKTLGGKRRVLLRMTAIEYGVLGILAGIIGSASSVAVTWAMSRFGDRPLPWQFQPWINVAGALLTALAVVLIGVAATWDVSSRKPLSTLREQ